MNAGRPGEPGHRSANIQGRWGRGGFMKQYVTLSADFPLDFACKEGQK